MTTLRCALQLSIIALLTSCCAGCFLTGSSSRSQTGTIKLNESAATFFERDPAHPSLYRSKDGAFMTVISECPVAKGSSPLTRTRQLFVGFKSVRLLHTSALTASAETVQKTVLSANLDKNILSAIVYSARRKKCAYDIVLWEPDGVDNSAALAAAANILESDLPFFLSSLGA